MTSAAAIFERVWWFSGTRWPGTDATATASATAATATAATAAAVVSLVGTRQL